ncbi:hypothetical protein FRZ03_27035 [Streptomyces misionensis]|uniref:Uncharacterized protein n=1 Tax=Streptomyces misionensis TaxID=67331 RepID=A0A5C6J2X0_9ACTN|nr:hypothetical protein FRZ03_27035 [Streptomyces misionensis]
MIAPEPSAAPRAGSWARPIRPEASARAARPPETSSTPTAWTGLSAPPRRVTEAMATSSGATPRASGYICPKSPSS